MQARINSKYEVILWFTKSENYIFKQREPLSYMVERNIYKNRKAKD